MNSQKFMLIALILLAITPGANQNIAAAGGATVVLSKLYPGLREAFIDYATGVAGEQSVIEATGNAAIEKLKIQVAAFNALNEPGTVVSYFERLDGKLMQEIFVNDPPTQAEVSAVWEMINEIYTRITTTGTTLKDLLSTDATTFLTNLPGFLKSLSELTMIANCIGIMYGVLCFTYNTATTCVKLPIKAIKQFYVWFYGTPNAVGASDVDCGAPSAATSAEIDAAYRANAAADDAATAAYNKKKHLLGLLAKIMVLDPKYDDMSIEDLNDNSFLVDGSMGKLEYEETIVPVIDAIRELGFNVTVDELSASQPPELPSYERMHLETAPEIERSLSAPAGSEYLDPKYYAAQKKAAKLADIRGTTRTNTGVIKKPSLLKQKRLLSFGDKKFGGRTKKYLKKKQRKSVRKQRKTKRGKRSRSQKSRRYKK
jgi:hypothetical protein